MTTVMPVRFYYVATTYPRPIPRRIIAAISAPEPGAGYE